jgi:transcriptional regulator with XRE-family HTH domain
MLDIILMSSDEIATELGARLKRRRLGLRMTQDEVAKRAGIFVGTVRNLEARTSASALGSVIRVALALGMADQFEHLFATRPRSIAQMEQTAEAPRQRARKGRRA